VNAATTDAFRRRLLALLQEGDVSLTATVELEPPTFVFRSGDGEIWLAAEDVDRRGARV
jgi:hypothetical protein